MSELSEELAAWTAALDFLGEAESSLAAALPRMTIHAAYYAMFHGARAVLLKIEGLSAPTKHNVVVSRFGYHAKQAEDPALLVAGRALNAMQQERLRSDYNTGRRPLPADAAAGVSAARSFLSTCAQYYNFPQP